MPSAKYSLSGSLLRLAKGSTAMDRSRTDACPEAAGEDNAAAKAAEVAKRSAGADASALAIAASTDDGIWGRNTRTDGTGPVSCLAMTACGVGPLNGGSPVSISYSTHPR